MNYWQIGCAALVFLIVLVPVCLRAIVRRMARNILDICRHAYGTRHELRRVDGGEFAGLDQGYYDETQAWLESQGFRLFGDLEDITANNPPASAPRPQLVPSFLRTMGCENDTIVAAFYHMRLKQTRKIDGRMQPIEKSVRMLEFVTYFSDDTCVSTQRSSPAALNDVPPETRRTILPEESLPEQLLAAHRSSVAQVLSTWKHATALPVRDFDEMVEFQHREADQRIAFRKRVGWITERELIRMAGDGKERFALALHKQIRKLLADDR